MNAVDARRERLRVERELGPTMCSGWTYYCLCSNHRHELMGRFEAALRDDETHAADLRSEIDRQAKVLAKRR